MRAMILCAGYGTRLAPLTEELPKPMLPMCGVPILEWGISMLVHQGIREIVINLHHLGHTIEEHFGDGSRFGADIRYVKEKDILGTGGGLKNALSLLDPDNADTPFVSMNGKLIFDAPVKDMVEAFRKSPEALGLMALRKTPTAEQWGAIDASPYNNTLRVNNILCSGQYMFGGIHITRPSTIRRLPDGEACMVRQGYLPWLQSGQTVLGYDVGNVYFAEHSTPTRYFQGNMDLLTKELVFSPHNNHQVHPTARISPTAEIHPPVQICNDAIIQDNAIVGPRTIVGKNAVVCQSVSVSNAVIWHATQVTDNETGSIITPSNRISILSED